MTTRTSPDHRATASILSGLDAALMVIALGIMYALIVYAPLGPAAAPLGLKAAAAGLIVGGGVAMLLGREIAVVCGPTATSALIASAMVDQLAAAGLVDDRRGVVLVATALAGLGAGLVPLALAGARLGAVLKFIPYPVLMGFVNSIGVSFIISALPFALGHDTIGRIGEAATWFTGWRPAAVVVAIVGTVAGYASVHLLPRAPAAFIALATATGAHHVIAATCADCTLGPLVAFGRVDPMPDLALAWSSRTALGATGWTIVLQAAVTLGILNAVFSLMAAAALTRPHDPPVDGNRLLAKLGGGTVASALVLGLPIAIIASVSKAVRNPAARSSTALAVYLVATAFVLGFADRLFTTIPMAAVASAVLVIARTQFDLSTWPLVRQAMRGRAARIAAVGPLAIMLLVVVIAVIRSLAAALFVGALAAVCLLALDLRRSVVVSVRDGRQRRSRRVWSPAARTLLDQAGDHIRVIEVAHWLYFGTADELARIVDREAGVRWLLLDARRTAGIDLTAARSLVHAAQRLAARGSHLVLAGIPADDARLRAVAALRVGAGMALEVATDVDLALERAEADLIGETHAVEAPALGVPGLETDEAARLERWLEPRRLATGETLFRAGDPGDALYIVRSGRITLWVDGDRGTRMRLLTFGPAGVFGEMALLDGRPRSAHADAEHDCELATLSRDGLAALAKADPSLHARLLRALALQLADRLRANTTMLQQMA